MAAIAASAFLALPQLDARAAGVPDGSAADVAVPRAVVQAVLLDYLTAAAQDGDIDAMNVLGVAYAAGVQVPRDYATALFWLQKAIDAGSANAMSNLATMYLRGMGLPRDPANALRWFARAAAGGNVQSMYIVAVMADEGMGASRDPRLAAAMYQRAAESGYAPAMVKLSDRRARSSATRDLVEACAWLQLAAQSEVPEELQIEVLAKLERLQARLGPEGRESARLRVAQLVDVVVQKRARAAAPKAGAIRGDVSFVPQDGRLGWPERSTTSSAAPGGNS